MAKPRAPAGGTATDSDDSLAFRTAMRDVKPLAHTPRADGLAKPKRRKPKARADALPLDESMPLVASAAPGDAPLGEAHSGPLSGSDPLTFQRAGVRTQVVRRLRRGLIPIEDQLDLHGLSQLTARDQLSEFLAMSRAMGRRCVRIIHGKGYRSGARGPILKIAVDLWLRRHLDVMAFTSARAIDGGTGAVYVLLRA